MNEIFKKIKEIKLSAQEKRAIFNKIDAFVRENPLNDSLKSMPLDSLKSMPVPHGIVSPWRQFYSLQYRHAFSFVIAIIMVLGGGASFVAADALPGDLLYPVKIGLNEKITPIFLNDIKKAIYSANLVGKRLKEATALISSDTLNDKKARILNEEIEKRASDVIS